MTQMSSMIDRTQPPAPGLPKDVVFPDYTETVLANGLKVIVYERHDIPTVTVNVVCRRGSFSDGEMPGTASLTAEMLTRGTATRSAVEIADEIECLGGSIGASAGWDSVYAGLTILSRNLAPAMEVLADVVHEPAFADDELDRVREQRLAAIMHRKSNPATLAGARFTKAVYGAFPYARPAEGSEESVAAMSRDHLAGFHAAAFVPANMFVIAVGDVHPSTFIPLVERLFGAAPSGSVPALGAHVLETPPAVQVHVVDRPTAVQSSIIVGHAGIPRSHPDYIAATIMNTILGGYFGSRLNLNLREDKGFTYGAHSRFEARAQAGPFSASTDVRNEVTADAVAEIIREITRLTEEPVGAAELEGVQRYVTGNFPIQIETPVQVAQRIITMELFGLAKSYYTTFNSAVMALTPDDILRAARTTLQPSRLVISVAGRADLLRGALARFGDVQAFDANDVAL